MSFVKTQLEALKSSGKEKAKICVFDIETFGFYGDEYAVGFYDGKTYKQFKGIGTALLDFLEFYLTKKYRTYKCCAHNGGKFDFLHLFKAIEKHGYFKKGFEIIPIPHGSRIGEVKIRKNKHVWSFRDSVSILPNSLKKLAEDFNVTRKGDFDHKKINPNNWENLEVEWAPYLKRDCFALFEILDKWENNLIEEFGVNLQHITTSANCAMRIYRTKFLKNTNLITYKACEDDIRQAYYGGRTEIFKFKGEDLNYYDVNSLYPYVMKTYDMPVDKPVLSYHVELTDFAIVYAEIFVPKDLDIPVLPSRMEIAHGVHKLVFRTGNIKGWYCTPELMKAVEKGCKVQIIKGYKFKKENLFKDYVNINYAEKTRQKGKSKIKYKMRKDLLNSLYGKFGQRREREKRVFGCPAKLIGKELSTFEENYEMYKETSFSNATYILPAIACFITSYARLELYKLLDGNEPYYCDTDSVVTKKVLKQGTKVGELELEKQIKRAVFLRPKNYYLELATPIIMPDGTEIWEEIKAKGFPKEQREKLTYEDYLNALDNKVYDNFKYEKEKLASLYQGLIRNKCFVGKTMVKRSIRSEYDKRIAIDGFDTKPLYIE